MTVENGLKCLQSHRNKYIINKFSEYNYDEIVKKLKSKFEIINFNERVTNYLLKRLNLKSDNELYNIKWLAAILGILIFRAFHT